LQLAYLVSVQGSFTCHTDLSLSSTTHSRYSATEHQEYGIRILQRIRLHVVCRNSVAICIRQNSNSQLPMHKSRHFSKHCVLCLPLFHYRIDVLLASREGPDDLGVRAVICNMQCPSTCLIRHTSYSSGGACSHYPPTCRRHAGDHSRGTPQAKIGDITRKEHRKSLSNDVQDACRTRHSVAARTGGAAS
jgi:hypothetical protein